MEALFCAARIAARAATLASLDNVETLASTFSLLGSIEASVWAAWIAAGASTLALLGNVLLQFWQANKMTAHQVALQNQQLTFQRDALKQTSEAAYMDWLRDKRLAAMVSLQEAFEEVLEVTDLWGSGENRAENCAAWEARVKAANKKMNSSAYRVRLVFGLKDGLLNDCSELAEFAADKFKLVLSTEESGQTMDNRYDEHQLWREEFGRKYAGIWFKMHVLTTPTPENEQDMTPRFFEVKATEESTSDVQT